MEIKDELKQLENDIFNTKDNLIEGRSSLTTVLTQTRIFCKKLDVDYQWITDELEGYHFESLKDANDNIPKYRLVNYNFFDMYNNPIIIDIPNNDMLIQNLIQGPLLEPISNFQNIGKKILVMRSGPPIELFHKFVEK